MEKRPILVLLGLACATGAFAEAYTWTDENGVVHYSDRPEPGAQVIDLPESKAARRPAPTTPAPAAADDADEEQQPANASYDSLSITSPAAEETLWNIEGTLDVSLALSPPLQPGHQVRIYFDGSQQVVSGTSFQLDGVYRGVHNLQAEVIDEVGKLIIRSQTNRFYVQQNSVVNRRPGR